MGNILVCDDERSICQMLDIALRREGHNVETVNSGEDAKKKLDSAIFDVIVTDIKMPNTSGIEVLRYAHQVSPDSAVILITAVDDYEAAVQAVKAGGATDYIRKSPGLIDEIKIAIRKALEKVTLSHQKFARQHHRRQPGHGETQADHPYRRFDPEHRVGLRREWHRKRTGSARRA